MRREDLRVWYCLFGASACIGRNTTTDPQKHRACGYRRVSDAELAELIESMGYVKPDVDQGWVKVPDCEDCSGTGRWPVAASKVAFTSESCPSCGGTGKQRMVAVGAIDTTKLGEVIHDSLLRTTGRSTTMGSFHAAEDAVAYLAALEGETDE